MAKANYGKLFDSRTHASTDEIFSEVLDADPGATGVTAWILDARGGTLVPYYLPLGYTDESTQRKEITDDGVSLRATVAANTLARITISWPVKFVQFGFIPADANSGALSYLDAFATGVKL